MEIYQEQNLARTMVICLGLLLSAAAEWVTDVYSSHFRLQNEEHNPDLISQQVSLFVKIISP